MKTFNISIREKSTDENWDQYFITAFNQSDALESFFNLMPPYLSSHKQNFEIIIS